MVDGLGRADSDVLIRARAIRPGLKILVTADATRVGERLPAAGDGMLAKPFSLAELAGAVRTALDGGVGTPRS